ncbi:MAG: hypothetical protein ACYDAY_07565 [Candidatus Dormibacteria bacterium]
MGLCLLLVVAAVVSGCTDPLDEYVATRAYANQAHHGAVLGTSAGPSAHGVCTPVPKDALAGYVQDWHNSLMLDMEQVEQGRAPIDTIKTLADHTIFDALASYAHDLYDKGLYEESQTVVLSAGYYNSVACLDLNDPTRSELIVYHAHVTVAAYHDRTNGMIVGHDPLMGHQSTIEAQVSISAPDKAGRRHLIVHLAEEFLT